MKLYVEYLGEAKWNVSIKIVNISQSLLYFHACQSLFSHHTLLTVNAWTWTLYNIFESCFLSLSPNHTSLPTTFEIPLHSYTSESLKILYSVFCHTIQIVCLWFFIWTFHFWYNLFFSHFYTSSSFYTRFFGLTLVCALPFIFKIQMKADQSGSIREEEKWRQGLKIT